MLHTIEIPPGQGLLVVDPGPLEPEGQGCVLECVLRLSAPLPDRRVAAALTLTELDPAGGEHPRGLRTLLVPARTPGQGGPAGLPPVRFVLPQALDVSGGGPRRVRLRVDCHYVDAPAACALPRE